MKIAIFSDNFYPELSGISDSIIASAKELAKLGHQVSFFVPEYSEKDYKTIGLNSKKEIDLGPNIKINRFWSFSYPTPTKQGRLVIPTIWRFLKVKKFKPDIIHSHLFFGVGLEALIAAKILKVPFVGTNHTAITEFVKYSPVKGKWVERLSLKYVNWYYSKCNLVTSPSELLLDEMKKNGLKRKCKVVYNPVDMGIFNLISSRNKNELKIKFNLNDKTIVYAGRLAPEKNIDVIIKAVALAKQKIPDITLALAGHGSFLGELKKLVTELGLDKNVKFIGTLSHLELANLYRASEVFSITSTSEIQSMTLIQAMACGLPVVGVRARGFEYIKENGILVEPGDIKDLSEKFILLLSDVYLRNKLSTLSLEFAEKLSDKNIAKEWEKIYGEVIAKTI